MGTNLINALKKLILGSPWNETDIKFMAMLEWHPQNFEICLTLFLLRGAKSGPDDQIQS